MANIADVVLGAGIALVTLFVTLFMITKVSNITAIDNTSDFYNTYQSLVTNTGTIFDILILVVIVVALGVALWALRAGTSPTKATGATAV